MDINITFGGGLKINATCEGHTIYSDQPVKGGGENSAPDPFTLFLSSIGMCAGYFVLKFCQSRNIPTSDIQVSLNSDFNRTLHVAENIRIDIKLPADFPEKYHNALLKSVDQCTVKKTILHGPEISVNLT